MMLGMKVIWAVLITVAGLLLLPSLVVNETSQEIFTNQGSVSTNMEDNPLIKSTIPPFSEQVILKPSDETRSDDACKIILKVERFVYLADSDDIGDDWSFKVQMKEETSFFLFPGASPGFAKSFDPPIELITIHPTGKTVGHISVLIQVSATENDPIGIPDRATAFKAPTVPCPSITQGSITLFITERTSPFEIKTAIWIVFMELDVDP